METIKQLLTLNSSLQVGVITLAKPFKDLDAIRCRQEEMVKVFERLGASLVLSDRLVMDITSLQETIPQLVSQNPDVILVILGSYSPDEILLEIAAAFNVPLILWAPTEALIAESFPPFASLVGLTQNMRALKRSGFPVFWLYGAHDAPRLLAEVARLVRILTARKNLVKARIGQIGSGCPGMLDTQFDAGLLKETLGLETVDISIDTFINRFRSVSDAQAAQAALEIQRMDSVSAPLWADCLEAAKAYLALQWLVIENKLSAIAVRCWPELKQQNVIAPCLALSLLTNQGVPAGCEGDALGAVSMLIVQLLTGHPAFLGDFVAVDELTDEVLMFHCGAGAAGLSENEHDLRLLNHSRPAMWVPGLTVEFPVGPGDATCLRLGQTGDVFRLLVATGATVKHQRFCRGTTLRFQPNAGARAFLTGLLEAGTEHHLVIARDNICDDVVLLCELWGVQPHILPLTNNPCLSSGQMHR
jgi:L-fucose isomerase-like protein